MQARKTSPYKARYSRAAREDLRGILLYISRDLHNLIAARELQASIERAIRKLKESPAAYTLVNDVHFAEIGVRRVFVKNYTVFFTINEELRTVYIERILYSRRDWENLL